ncbi:hypothetical protein [Nocardia sp. NPDC020380]|uniref:hypothetical protein n=1 Tax=Nocardia sp. NPDC020380 TaxID=3364309 RepID=UPI0037B45DEA
MSEPYSEPDRESAERELFELVRKAGFTGSAWKLLADRLVRHGLAVMGPWIRTGWIFKVATDKGMPVRCTDQERELVATRLCEDVLQETVTSALERFRKHCLDGDGWRADGGTSLATYFVNGCVMAFVDNFRRSRRCGELFQQRVAVALPAADDDPNLLSWLPSDEDLAGSVVAGMEFRRRLARLSPRDRGLAWGKAMGLRGAEIRDLFGWSSVKAVEQRWARVKRDDDWCRGLAGTEE